MLVRCSYCGDELNRKPSRIKKHLRQYCNRECQANHYVQIFKGKNNPNFKNVPLKVCKRCGKEYRSYSKNTKYCSAGCISSNVTSICEFCGEEFKTYKSQKNRRKFCSALCNNKKRVEEGSITRQCSFCKKSFTTRKFLFNQKYCSTKCWGFVRKELLKGNNNPRWLGGTDNYRGEDWVEQRRKVFERDNYTCQVCGEQERKIHVHHVIPWRVSKDNSLSNLICLCTSCHPHEENHYRQFRKPSYRIVKLLSEKYPVGFDRIIKVRV